jgi:hypothetical protein
MNINDLKQMKFLVLTRGIYFQCDDSENTLFNLAKEIIQVLLSTLNNINSSNKEFLHEVTEMFKVFIVFNRDWYIYSSYPICYFLIYTVYRTQYYRHAPLLIYSVNIECYKAVINLLLFSMPDHRLQIDIKDKIQKNLFDILRMMMTFETVNKN